MLASRAHPFKQRPSNTLKTKGLGREEEGGVGGVNVAVFESKKRVGYLAQFTFLPVEPICHHMCFGNKVTCFSLKAIWLRMGKGGGEGFTTKLAGPTHTHTHWNPDCHLKIIN